MPYANPYPVNLPDIDEARLDAIQTRIIDSLADLNAALNRDAACPMSFLATQVILGDPENLTRSLICVTGGGEQDATDADTEGEFMPRGDKSGPKTTWYTNIYVYIHRDEMKTDDPEQYVAYRERARARIAGHLRKRVFNSRQGAVIGLASQEYTSGSDFDQLNNCFVKTIKKGLTVKGQGGGQLVYSVHLMHVGTTEG